MKKFVKLFENFHEEPSQDFAGQVDSSEILKIFHTNGLEAAIAAAKAAGMSKEDFTALVSDGQEGADSEPSAPYHAQPGMQSDDSMNIVDGQ